MKCHKISTSYFFQKTCYHSNHIMHSVAPPKSKAIVLLREQVGEIFLNFYITCYQEWSSKFFKKFFQKNFLKIGMYTHPIHLSCHQKFEKNSPTGSGNIAAQSWKIWKSHGRLDPTLRMREVVHARSIEFPRVRNDRLLSGRILCEKEIFSFWSFYGLQEK